MNMIRLFPMVLIPFALISLAGCGGRGLSIHYYEREPVVRRAPVHIDHICARDCHHHYHDGTRLVVLDDRHHHGRHCGHHWNGSHWVGAISKSPRTGHVKRVGPGVKRVGKVGHKHGPQCGCVFDRAGSKWVVVRKGHVHGRGCGHVRIKGRWTIH